MNGNACMILCAPKFDLASGRHKHPTAGCLDSQSVKTTHVPGTRGARRGEKRHTAQTSPSGRHARLADDYCRHCRLSARERRSALRCWLGRSGSGKKLRRLWVDGGYCGSPLSEWVAARFRIALQVVLRGEEQMGFAVLPRRSCG